jgi:hypothetical protein
LGNVNVGTTNNSDIMLIMFTDETFQRICDCTKVHMEGTFKIVPELFRQHNRSSQLFTIHGYGDQRLFPWIMALLRGKNEATYAHLLETIKNFAHQKNLPIHWEEVTTDFETGLRAAIRRSFAG